MAVQLKLFQLLLKQKLLGKGLKGKPLTPQIVSYAVTKACNFNCLHCHANAGKSVSDELTEKEAQQVICDMKELGTEVVIFSGGEPLLRKRLIITLTQQCSDLGIIPAMLTNGTLLDYPTALRLKDAGMTVVGIPLDFSIPERQDAFRGKKGAFHAAIKAIKACLAAGLEVVATTMILKNNMGDLPKILDLLSRLGVDQIVLYDLVPVGRAKNLSELSIQCEQRIKLLNDLYRLQEKKDVLFLISGGNPLYCGALLEMHRQHGTQPPGKMLKQFLIYPNVGCHAGLHYFSLRPNGDVYPCPFLQISAGNIRQQSLSEIWLTSPILQKLRNRSLLQGQCGVCRYREICGGCRARAYWHTGNPLGEDPLCPLETLNENGVSLNAIECFCICVG